MISVSRLQEMGSNYYDLIPASISDSLLLFLTPPVPKKDSAEGGGGPGGQTRGGNPLVRPHQSVCISM